jgi:hypothetical protein
MSNRSKLTPEEAQRERMTDMGYPEIGTQADRFADVGSVIITKLPPAQAIVEKEGCDPDGADLAFQTNEMGYGGDVEAAVLAHMWAEQG